MLEVLARVTPHRSGEGLSPTRESRPCAVQRDAAGGDGDGLAVSELMADVVPTETYFSWPGVGKWRIELIGRRDYPRFRRRHACLGGRDLRQLRSISSTPRSIRGSAMAADVAVSEAAPPTRSRWPYSRSPRRCSIWRPSPRTGRRLRPRGVGLPRRPLGRRRDRADRRSSSSATRCAGRRSGRPAAPGEFPLGTDGDGHDTLSWTIDGARVSLLIGFAVMAVSFVIGTALGLFAAMTGPIVDVAVTRARWT